MILFLVIRTTQGRKPPVRGITRRHCVRTLLCLPRLCANVPHTTPNHHVMLLVLQRTTQPFPSLTQCYKYNTEACCVSGHDKKIKDDYGGFLSDTCHREYQELEYYFCLGCHPNRCGDTANICFPRLPDNLVSRVS